MKRKKLNRIVQSIVVAGSVAGFMLAPQNELKVHAATATATVQGTVLSGTTTDILYLSTKEGKMEIKLDTSTDTSSCKFLLPDNKVSVSVANGGDGYMHAVKISTVAGASNVTIDHTTETTVSGTISSKSNSETLYFNTKYGEMELKMDDTTDLSGVSVLVEKQTYSIVVARGSDAYMHAVKIYGGNVVGTTSSTSSTTTASSNLTPASADPSGRKAATMTFTGTVLNKTTESLLYLSTNDGEMQFVIEANTDSSKSIVLNKGKKVTVTGYNGSDEYWHAVDIIGTKTVGGNVTLDASTSTVTGTVNSKSTEEMLYFDITQGTMELKMDTVQSITGCKVIVPGRKLTITCARGNDAYMHVVSITG